MSETSKLATAVTWPQEDADIEAVILYLRPGMSHEEAKRIMRTLLDIAKVAAFGAGAKYAIAEMKERGMIGDLMR